MKHILLTIIVMVATTMLHAQYGVNWMAEPTLDFDYVEEFSDSTYFTKVGKNEQYGLVDMYGKAVLPLSYDEIWIADKQTWIVKKNGKYGLWTKDIGTPQCNYDYLNVISYRLYNAGLNGKAGVINHKLEVIIPFEYDKISEWRTTFIISDEGYYHDEDVPNSGMLYLLAFKENEGYAVFSLEGQQLTLPNKFYNSIFYEKGNNVFVGLRAGQIEVIKDQKLIDEYQAKEIVSVYQGVVLFKEENEKWGAVAVEGKMLIEPNFDYILFNMYREEWVTDENNYVSMMIAVTEIEDTTIKYEMVEEMVEVEEIEFEETEREETEENIVEEKPKVYYPMYTFFNMSGVKISDTLFSDIFFIDNETAIGVNQNMEYECIISAKDGLQKMEILENYTRNEIKYYSLDNYRTPAAVLYPKLREIIAAKQFDEINIASEQRITVMKNEKWGVLDLEGNIIVEPTYDYVYPFKEGYAKVILGEKYGLIDSTGNLVVRAIYNDIYPFHNGYAIVKRGEKYGLIDLNGKLILGTNFDFIDVNQFNVIFAKQNNKKGVFDTNGNILIHPTYDNVSITNDGKFIEVSNGDWRNKKEGIYTLQGKEILSCVYDNITYYEEGFFITKRNELRGMYGMSGQVIAYESYKYLSVEKNRYTNELTIKATKGSTDGYLTPQGRFFITCTDKYNSNRETYSEGMLKFKQYDKYGFYDNNGNIIIPAIYDDVAYFYKDKENMCYAKVQKNGKWGLIDKTGKVVVPIIYDWVDFFVGKTAMVQKNEKYGFVNRNGNESIPVLFDDIKPTKEKIMWLKVNGKWGIAINPI